MVLNFAVMAPLTRDIRVENTGPKLSLTRTVVGTVIVALKFVTFLSSLLNFYMRSSMSSFPLLATDANRSPTILTRPSLMRTPQSQTVTRTTTRTGNIVPRTFLIIVYFARVTMSLLVRLGVTTFSGEVVKRVSNMAIMSASKVSPRFVTPKLSTRTNSNMTGTTEITDVTSYLAPQRP